MDQAVATTKSLIPVELELMIPSVSDPDEEEKGKLLEEESKRIKESEKKSIIAVTKEKTLSMQELIKNGIEKLLDIRKIGYSLDSLAKVYIQERDISYKGRKKSILLDLDQTLILTITNENWLDSGLPIRISKELGIPFVIRPGAIRFVKTLCKYAEIILYSAATPDYISDIINSVQTFKENISHILTRENCLHYKGGYLKSAKIINRIPQDIIIVDDSFWAYPDDLDNVIPVRPFRLAKYLHDLELLFILHFIISLLSVPDVRKFIPKMYNLRKIIDPLILRSFSQK